MPKPEPGDTRQYHPGEDMEKFRAGVIVCQHGGDRGRYKICMAVVTKESRYTARTIGMTGGGWWDVYVCTRDPDHRFAIRQGAHGKLVKDVGPKRTPTFGDPLGF